MALTPSTYYTATTPTAINFTLELRQPLGVGGHILVTATQTLWSGTGALTIKSVSNGIALDAGKFTAEVTSATQVKISVGAGANISNTAPFVISLESGVAKFASLGPVSQIVGFGFTTQLATTILAADGWTVVAAPQGTAGLTFLSAAAAAGDTFVQLYDTTGFYNGNLVHIGKVPDKFEEKTIQGIYASTDCLGAEKATTGRRLWAATDMGSIRLDSGLTNAYPADTAVGVVSTNYGPTCFPGDATVNVYGRGATDVASLSVGDSVLVESGAFEPVLSFLHKVPGVAQALKLVHAQGVFRASENHIVFTSRGDMPASALRPGDEFLVQSVAGEKPMPSVILAIGREITTTGMYAPFTSSGALVVDGVVASNYGAPSSRVSLPHGAAHAAFFALRMFHHLDLGTPPKLDVTLHPFAKMMFQHLQK